VLSAPQHGPAWSSSCKCIFANFGLSKHILWQHVQSFMCVANDCLVDLSSEKTPLVQLLQFFFFRKHPAFTSQWSGRPAPSEPRTCGNPNRVLMLIKQNRVYNYECDSSSVPCLPSHLPFFSTVSLMQRKQMIKTRINLV